MNDAARWLSVYSQGITGSITQILASGTSFRDYRQDTQPSLMYPESQQDYIEDMLYDPVKDVLEFRNGVYVRVRYSFPSYPRINYLNTIKAGRPDWIDNPPKTILGYQVGIGMANARVNHRNTLIASYENAIFSLISTVAMHIRAMEEYVDSFAAHSVQQQDISVHTAKGSVEGFYVLETWTDPKDMSVWTLAIAENCTVN
ncbi:hypothetical protein FACS1894109_19330 [Spirochaetia bacterium]|nr:hypothetical protein FACS1894109_19330 [Spirochaetia bacterium]